ncbi:MAG: ABC transporter permease subunit [Dehalococcoidales bacterium]|nr:ABC transporter permease subunit [Dehalococcoidales bacterium]
MNWRAIRAIVRKDLKVVTQSKAVLLPLILVPLIMLVIIPAAFALVPSMLGSSLAADNDMQIFLANMPAGLKAELAGYNVDQQMVVMGLVYFLAPMYLIIPLMVASVIAADSFAGEKERKTMEALLYSPTTDSELFTAKLLSAWVPAVIIALVGFVVYGVVANAAAWPLIGRIFFPNLMWVLMAVWVAPAVAGLGLGATVLVSSRVQTFQEAYQMGGMVVLPVIFLVVGQATGVMYFSVALVALLGLIVWAIDAALLWYGAKSFQRGQVIAKI